MENGESGFVAAHLRKAGDGEPRFIHGDLRQPPTRRLFAAPILPRESGGYFFYGSSVLTVIR
jgi:hypothetical protein